MRHCPGANFLPNCIVTTVKQGGDNAMVWGCIAGNQVGDSESQNNGTKSVAQLISASCDFLQKTTCGSENRFPTR